MAQGGSNGPWGKRNEWEEVLSRLPHLPKFMKAGIPGFILLIIIAVWAASVPQTAMTKRKGTNMRSMIAQRRFG